MCSSGPVPTRCCCSRSSARSSRPAAAEPFTPEAVAAATGVPPEVTREIAAAIAAAPSAAIYGRVGVSTQEFGGLATWPINVLNIVTGNLDREGGMMFTRPAVDLVPLAARAGLRG